MMGLDSIDRAILMALQRDGRLSNVVLADEVGLSESACLRRVKILEKTGIIDKYTMLVDQTVAGKPGNVFVQITLERQTKEELATFEAAVRRVPEVMECYLMTGEFDYLLRVVVPDLEAYEHFLLEHLTRIKGIASIKSSFSLKQVCYKTTLPLPH